ncbi:hypothetical protein HLH34_15230 [Gluconacetobacter azotocaptans]|uniref:Uncharacterized protein n=1 Tax=Gluconacetobacter azotocaptans TaxID=142834 RepID=A0A7W4PF43_9PROT|nr:hypothetical protein [Gluconacetobacter azotocaptans]MBB2191295.1 hypothetical protein [Gluconacetobacter azotocaptans]GBQ33868.1 hypothetical protein AA13594_2736 [Gluconacetobacter azotocaptans DSM 13594]
MPYDEDDEILTAARLMALRALIAQTMAQARRIPDAGDVLDALDGALINLDNLCVRHDAACDERRREARPHDERTTRACTLADLRRDERDLPP